MKTIANGATTDEKGKVGWTDVLRRGVWAVWPSDETGGTGFLWSEARSVLKLKGRERRMLQICNFSSPIFMTFPNPQKYYFTVESNGECRRKLWQLQRSCLRSIGWLAIVITRRAIT